MWFIIEGVDRSGKSTVAALYKQQGYEVIHMSAPDKKYRQKGYAGPSYLDDMLEMYMQYDGKDIVFDRSIYGETIWPHVYGREPSLTEEDIEVLQEFEERNQTSRILMIDPDQAGHWKRCVDNNEPLTHSQFRLASTLYTKLAHKYNFAPKKLSDYSDKFTKTKTENNEQTSNADYAERQGERPIEKGQDIINSSTSSPKVDKISNEKTSGLNKLEKANAISAVLSKRIIKQRGNSFDELEGEISDFLQGRLEELLGGKSKQPSLSEIEVQILKQLAQRFIEKESQSQRPTPVPQPSSGQRQRG